MYIEKRGSNSASQLYSTVQEGTKYKEIVTFFLSLAVLHPVLLTVLFCHHQTRVCMLTG